MLQTANDSIASIDALAVLDSRGRPTVRAYVTAGDRIYVATAPSGVSTGTLESTELRDGQPAYGGLGVNRAVDNVRSTIASALEGRSVLDQSAIDRTLVELDGTPTRSHLGANAIVAVSMAAARAGAATSGVPLWRYLTNGEIGNGPIPAFNVLNGGAHARGGLRLQEFMLVPTGPKTMADRVRCGSEVYSALRVLLAERDYSTGLGDEGGFIFSSGGVNDALDLLVGAILRAGYEPGKDVGLAIDAAATSFYSDGMYEPEPGLSLASSDMIAWWSALLDRFPIVLLEDPLAEDDWNGWHDLTAALGGRSIIVGDDIFVTNARIVERAVREGVGNAVLLKPNQIGTVSETIDAAHAARAGGYKLMVSHRSGETSDSFIADLAVALDAEFLKSGAPARSERTEKYNRLLEIEHERATASRARHWRARTPERSC
jgi:enolase